MMEAPQSTAAPPSTDPLLPRFRTLIAVARSLGGEQHLEMLLRQITEAAASLVDAERATLYLVDVDQEAVVAHVVTGASFTFRLKLSDLGLVTFVARTGQLVNVPDAYTDERFNPAVDRLTGYRTSSVLTVPMRDRTGAVIGVLQALNKREGRFGPEDEELLEALGGAGAVALQNAQLQTELEQQFASFAETLMAMLDARDPETAGHSARVTALADLMARELGLAGDRVEVTRLAAQLHDLGKVRVPEAILAKPGALTPEEYGVMRRHVEWTQEILRHIHFRRQWHELPDIAMMHHERPDGLGYPRGLHGSAIPLEARIIAVADAFDVLVAGRHYRMPLAAPEALAKLERDGLEGRVDSSVVAALRRLYERGALTEILDVAPPLTAAVPLSTVAAAPACSAAGQAGDGDALDEVALGEEKRQHQG